MPTLVDKLNAISEARLRIGAAGRILEQAQLGQWDVGPVTVKAIDSLCKQAVEHLRGIQ